jgi:riboflavin kinase/FMN adenylyltransferase
MIIVNDTTFDFGQSAPRKRSVVTIGAYDGVHRGHQAVIEQVRQQAEILNAQSVVVTFDRHPASVVRPASAPLLLTDLDQKLELLASTGLDATCIVKFDVTPIELISRGDGVDEPVSSTAIRRALAGGQVELATQLLGHHFEVRGKVVHGDQRGRTIGFPTANIEVPKVICIPADGVYAGVLTRTNGDTHVCAINLGRRPTFYEHADHSLLEAHLLDFDGDLYGESVRVSFSHFLRGERKFENIDALKMQLKHDIEQTRAVSGL